MTEDRFVGKYPISVASRLTGVPEHRLRAFEAAGLLQPPRTQGGTRLYSDADLERVRKIAELVEKGVNYAGIREILGTAGEAERMENTKEGEEQT
jgi:MerR family transcriptional regulator/heat shock protein HspR